MPVGICAWPTIFRRETHRASNRQMTGGRRKKRSGRKHMVEESRRRNR